MTCQKPHRTQATTKHPANEWMLCPLCTLNYTGQEITAMRALGLETHDFEKLGPTGQGSSRMSTALKGLKKKLIAYLVG